MNDEDTTTSSKTSYKGKNEDKKRRINNASSSHWLKRRKKVVVVKPGEPDVNVFDTQDRSEEEDDNISQFCISNYKLLLLLLILLCRLPHSGRFCRSGRTIFNVHCRTRNKRK